MFGPYFWAAFILITFCGSLIGHSGIHPLVGIPIIIVLGWFGGRLAAKCDRDRPIK